MLVVEKTHHIEAYISGSGIELLKRVIQEQYPGVIFTEDNSEEKSMRWKDTVPAKEIQAAKTPGKLLRAYRERAGFSLVELAEAVGIKYPNISAMENDRRTIGLVMAKKLGNALRVDYTESIGRKDTEMFYFAFLPAMESTIPVPRDFSRDTLIIHAQ